MSKSADVATDPSCPTCGAAVAREDLLWWPDGVATGLCGTCHHDVLLPASVQTPSSD